MKQRKAHMAIARTLRKRSTEPERILWRHLRNRRLEYKFRRQVPLCGFIVDFACLEKKVVIELDGSQHGTERARATDTIRDARLKGAGFRVLRFANKQVYEDLPTIIEQIYAICSNEEMGDGRHG